jgi:D-sedoheptulose 7-phosphate isomerase
MGDSMMDMNMYYKDLFQIINSMVYTDVNNINMEGQYTLEKCLDYINILNEEHGKIIVVGNGGSAAIASHTAIDYLKNGGIHTVTFNEASLVTCFGNDYGYEYVFAKPIEKVTGKNDILIAISSSGKSKNILNAVESFSKLGKRVITLSGFKKTNPLRKMGHINIYVSSMEFGFVELAHQIFLHMILDIYNKRKSDNDEKKLKKESKTLSVPLS